MGPPTGCYKLRCFSRFIHFFLSAQGESVGYNPIHITNLSQDTYTHTYTPAHIHTQKEGERGILKQTNVHVFVGGNSHRHKENMRTPHRKTKIHQLAVKKPNIIFRW